MPENGVGNCVHFCLGPLEPWKDVQWKQEGESKFVPEHINSHDKRNIINVKCTLTPLLKQKPRIYFLEIGLRDHDSTKLEITSRVIESKV